MKKIALISELPNKPAVYAIYGGRGNSSYVAYVGIAKKLKGRIMQHLTKRDSSIVTGAGAAVLNTDYITKLKWWEHPDFKEKANREAAELVAFDILNPQIKSRGNNTNRAKELYNDESFREKMNDLFLQNPTGTMTILTPQEALIKICEIEKRVEKLEKLLISRITE